MSRKSFSGLSLGLAALLAASPAFAQSVIVSESAVQVQPLSPSLGSTESLAIVSPELAEQLIEIPVASGTPVSGEVSPSLGETESLAIVTPTVADAITDASPIAAAAVPASVSSETFVLSDPEPSVIDTLPRISPDQAIQIVTDDLTVDPNAEPAEEDVSLYIVEDGQILPSSAWDAAQSAACKASGGIEIPLPAGRIACFKL